MAHVAWQKILSLICPACEIVRDTSIRLVFETGNGMIFNSIWTARKLIDDLYEKDIKKIYGILQTFVCATKMLDLAGTKSRAVVI